MGEMLIWSIPILFYTILSEYYIVSLGTNDDMHDMNLLYKLSSMLLISISGPLLLPKDLTYNIVILEIVLCIILHVVLTDIIFYHTHRYLHMNKYLYTTVHKYHHTPKYMNAYVSTYEHPVETLLAKVVPFLLFTYLWFLFSTNIWSWLISTLTVIFITVIGHSGYKPTPLSLILCPFLLVLRLIPEAQNGLEHEMHHKYYNCNYASFLRVWDDYYSTADHYVRPKTSVKLFFTRIVFICLSLIFPVEGIVLFLTYNAYLIYVRSNIGEIYVDNCIYGYHPHGYLSLPAFLTFAWSSLNTKLAVRDALTWVPGTCGVDLESIRNENSVAIALDGRLGNKIIKRKGFCTVGKNLCPCLVLGYSYDVVFGNIIPYDENTEVLQGKYYDELYRLANKHGITLEL